MPRRAVIYCRISRDRVGAGLGVDRQETDCRALAEQLGWAIVAVRSDNDLSAYSGKRRPEYEAMLDDLRSGTADAVIAWHPDRLHRRPTELEAFIDLCEQHAVAVQTVQAGEVDLNTPSGRAIARTLGAWARHEVEHSIARQKRAKQQAAAEGKYRGGRRAFGYEADGMTVRPDEALVLEEASRRVLVGESLNSITRDLNARGLRTSAGGAWTYTTLRRAIMRPRNAGLVEHNGEPIGPASWPAIVDPDVWRAVTNLLADPSRRTPRSTDQRFLGSGLFVCGVCGSTMLTATTLGAGRKRRPAYRCRGGPHLTRIAEPVDHLVSEVVIRRLSRPDARLLLRADKGVDVAGLQDRANALRGRLDELSALYADGSIDARQLTTGSASGRAQLNQVEAEIAAAVAGSPLAGFADAADVRTAWDAASVSRRKAVIRALLTVTLLKAPPGRQPDGSYFNPDFVKIDWRADE